MIGQRIQLVERPIITSGLISRWCVDGSANDVSGNGYHGTLQNGATWAADNFGQALSLDGSDDYMSTPALGISGSAARTFCCWIRKTATTSIKSVFFFGENATAKQFTIHIGAANTNDLYVAFSACDVRTAGNIIVAGELIHIAVRFAGGTIHSNTSIYKNGVSLSTVGIGSDTTANTTNSTGSIGSDPYALRRFDGKISDARVYNRALSANEIAAIAAGKA